MKNAEIGEVLPNGNVFVKIGKFDTIEIIDSNKVFTAQIFAEVITDAINQLSVCAKCGKVSKTQNGLCYSCYQLSDGGTIWLAITGFVYEIGGDWMQDFSHTDKLSKLHSGSNWHQTATVLYTRLWCVLLWENLKREYSVGNL